jgi:hypothetical protein
MTARLIRLKRPDGRKWRVFANLHVKNPSNRMERARAIQTPIGFLWNMNPEEIRSRLPKTSPEIKEALLAEWACPMIPPIKMRRAYEKTIHAVFLVFA